ncbi:MAG: GMC family oxidoreductase [Hyphomicrobiales bacterium]
MLVPLTEITASETQFDCCIVGAGPAGITLALALANRGWKVALIESGGWAFSSAAQSLNDGYVSGDPYPDLSATRLRYLGGTSNHWGGFCRPLDAEDFESRPERPGWPIKRDDLDPYLTAAGEILEIGKSFPADRLLQQSGGLLKEIIFHFSPPVRFGEKYFNALAASPNIALCLDATVTGFEHERGRVTGLLVKNASGDAGLVRSQVVTLAAGAIENVRLLLWGNEQLGGALVENPSLLGRFVMDHPHFTTADALLVDERLLHADPSVRVLSRPVFFISPSADFMQTHGVLNCCMRLRKAGYSDTRALIADLACVAPETAQWAASLFDRDLICGAHIHAVWEQLPRSENRIKLVDEKDAMGVPRVHLHLTRSDLERHTALACTEALGTYMAAAGIGRLKIKAWLQDNEPYPANDELVGPHQLGGTRMSATSKDGIVDRNCRVFGTSNLYVASGSVFPAGGHANPTLTIVQITLRLADHLHRERLSRTRTTKL